MRIAFDAKRAFHNGTGLGHYSRTLIRSLAHYYPQHEYLLLNPRRSHRFELQGHGLEQVLPEQWLHRTFSGVWRSRWCCATLEQKKVALYHGLSHELPVGIGRTGIPAVVTMHDLIPERHPEQYPFIDAQIYKRKSRYACEQAHRIIAISEQTKRDIIEYYGIDEQKIKVCYQSCDPRFYTPVSETEKERIRLKYQLPPRYFLSVGSIIERKNLLTVCKAMQRLQKESDIPLLVIGSGSRYKRKVESYLAAEGLQHRVLFLSDRAALRQDVDFNTAADFPALYQLATALIYPSYFEGFGIPVLEGLCSRIPVITSDRSCLPEAGGPGAFYTDPDDPVAMAAAMQEAATANRSIATRIERGWDHAQQFMPDRTAAAVMKVYEELL